MSTSNSIVNLLDKYTAEIIVLQIGLLLILTAIIVWIYLFNRKKYHNLKHQIPASVVKNYLDSIIQNSTALKSSLFRGGGLDVDPSSIPSVMPVGDLSSSTPVGVNVDVGSSTSGGDEALRAEVSRLQAQLSEKQNTITDLEKKNTELEGIVKAKQERIEELEALLAKAQESGGGDSSSDSELQSKLDEVTAERDRLKEDLSQYDIIEDDLADLKRLKQENEQLKSALDGGDAPAAAADIEEKPSVEEPVAEPEKVEEPTAEAPAEEAQAAPPSSEDDKSPEDLLSEFEKMLG